MSRRKQILLGGIVVLVLWISVPMAIIEFLPPPEPSGPTGINAMDAEIMCSHPEFAASNFDFCCTHSMSFAQDPFACSRP